MNNYINDYHALIKSKKIRVSKWIELIYEYITDGIEKGDFFYDGKKAHDAIDWIETHCFHVEGPLAPGPFKLELWQKALLSCMYGIVTADGLRQFREVVLIVARKKGKSLLAASIGRYEWIQNGGYGSRVFCLAPKFDQADIIYNGIWQMTQLDPDWKAIKAAVTGTRKETHRAVDDSELARHRQTDLFLPCTNSTVKKIAFNAKTSDGFNPSLCVCDEIASWEGDKGLKQYEVMKSGMGARPEAILLSRSTSGYVNDSIYDELLKRSTRFLQGDSKEKKLLPFLYMIDDLDKWDDLEELEKSNPNLGVSVSKEYMQEEIAVANGSLSKKAEFITKYCNIKQNSSLAWLSARDVNGACCEPLDMWDFRDCYAVGGIDLSQTTDLTACCVVVEKEGVLYVFEQFFLPSERLEEATARDGLPYSIYAQRGLLTLSGNNYVDYHDCFNWFTSLISEHHIYPLKIGYDRYSAQYLVQDLEAYGFQTDDVYQGDNLYPVILEMQGILEDGRMRIGDNDLLKAHMLDSAIKMSVERGRGKLVKVRPMAHIDGVAALLDALTVRQKWAGEIGRRLKNESI